VAEDDAVSRELLCSRLRRWGYEVTATQNGADAMAELEKDEGPIVAILDCMMPGMDGLEITRRVRALGRPAYIILLTACGNKENVVAGFAAGADDYLIKPLEKDMLQARIRTGARLMALLTSLAERDEALARAASRIQALEEKAEN